MFALPADQLPNRRKRWLPLVGVLAAFFWLSGFEHQELLEKAAAGDRSVQFSLGYYYYDKENPDHSLEKAFHWFLKSAEKGVPRSLVVVSRFYRDGLVVEKDPDKAAAYRQRAVDAIRKIAPTTDFQFEEDIIAYNFQPLGVDDRDADYKEELFWRRKAAEKGASYSQWMLGALYEFGKGVKQDRKLAADWYRKAGMGKSENQQKGGHKNARKSFCRLAVKVDFIPRDDPQFVQWCK